LTGEEEEVSNLSTRYLSKLCLASSWAILAGLKLYFEVFVVVVLWCVRRKERRGRENIMYSKFQNNKKEMI